MCLTVSRARTVLRMEWEGRHWLGRLSDIGSTSVGNGCCFVASDGGEDLASVARGACGGWGLPAWTEPVLGVAVTSSAADSGSSLVIVSAAGSVPHS